MKRFLLDNLNVYLYSEKIPANKTCTIVKLVVHHKRISDLYKYRLTSFPKYLFMQYNNPFYTNNLFACRSTACSIYPI